MANLHQDLRDKILTDEFITPTVYIMACVGTVTTWNDSWATILGKEVTDANYQRQEINFGAITTDGSSRRIIKNLAVDFGTWAADQSTQGAITHVIITEGSTKNDDETTPGSGVTAKIKAIYPLTESKTPVAGGKFMIPADSLIQGIS